MYAPCWLLLVTLAGMARPAPRGGGGSSSDPEAAAASSPLAGHQLPDHQAQILGIRRIQIARPGSINENRRGRVVEPPRVAGTFHPGRRGWRGAVDDSDPRAGRGSDGGGGGGSDDEEDFQRQHEYYRQVQLVRKREQMLQHLPAAGGGGTGTGTNPLAPPGGYVENIQNGTLEMPGDDRNCSEAGNGTDAAGTRRCVDRSRSVGGGGPVPGRPLNRMEWIERERYKQARLFMIQTLILQKLGIQRQPNLSDLYLSDNQRSRIMDAFRNYETELGTLENEEGYTRSLSLLTPSCELPRNTNRAWRDGSRFRLYFHILPPNWKSAKISSASLKLYKRAVGDGDCQSRSAEDEDREEVPVRSGHQADRAAARQGRRQQRRQRRLEQQQQQHQRRSPAGDSDMTEEVQEEAGSAWLITPGTPGGDRMNQQDQEDEDAGEEGDQEEFLRVSVYAYTKPVKARRKERFELLDSNLVRRSYQGWVKLDIQAAANTWYHNPHKNFGLQVRIENHQQRPLDAFCVLTPANCTINSNFSLPYPLAGGVVDSSELNVTGAEENQTTPYLDLVTLGMPRSNLFIRNKRKAEPPSTAGQALRDDVKDSNAKLNSGGLRKLNNYPSILRLIRNARSTHQDRKLGASGRQHPGSVI